VGPPEISVNYLKKENKTVTSGCSGVSYGRGLRGASGASLAKYLLKQFIFIFIFLNGKRII